MRLRSLRGASLLLSVGFGLVLLAGGCGGDDRAAPTTLSPQDQQNIQDELKATQEAGGQAP